VALSLLWLVTIYLHDAKCKARWRRKEKDGKLHTFSRGLSPLRSTNWPIPRSAFAKVLFNSAKLVLYNSSHFLPQPVGIMVERGEKIELPQSSSGTETISFNINGLVYTIGMSSEGGCCFAFFSKIHMK
jgi:hypothetical protein